MKFDAIIIGTGQAGPPLAVKLAGNGSKTAIIEKSELGGTCVNNGCTPTKAYIASARRAFVARNSREMGVTVDGEVEVDLRTIKARKDALVNSSRKAWNKKLTETENLTLYRGKAVFKNPHCVEVNGEQLTADRIYINVGGRPRIPDGFEKVNYLTNETILQLEEIPDHLIIAGGGYVGLEFAQMFRRFGSEVTVLELSDRLMPQEDPEISEAIADVLGSEGITIRLKAKCISASGSGKEIEARVKCEQGEPTVKGSHLLIATGRVPNTDDLGLENTGVETDEKGFIKVDDKLQTSVDHIFALGDCNGEGAFTHTAYNDYEIVKSHLFEDKKKYLSDRFKCYAAFIDPALARVGMNAAEIRKKGIQAQKASLPLSKVARAKEMGETKGMMTIYVEEESELILGATFLGARADEYIHIITDMMYAGAPYSTIRDAVHIHPTISELLPTMLEKPGEM